MPLSIDGMNVGQYSYRPIGTAGNSLQTNALNRVQPTTQRLEEAQQQLLERCLLYTSPSPRDQRGSRMPSSA